MTISTWLPNGRTPDYGQTYNVLVYTCIYAEHNYAPSAGPMNYDIHESILRTINC